MPASPARALRIASVSVTLVTIAAACAGVIIIRRTLIDLGDMFR